MKETAQKTVLLVEDEPEVVNIIKELFEPYTGMGLGIEPRATAAHVLGRLFCNTEKPAVDALILDIMIPYGSNPDESVKTRKILGGSADKMDMETGILLLKKIREKEKEENRAPLWVAVITARNAPRVLQTAWELIENSGRVYIKPFNDILLENDIVTVLEIESKVPGELLPRDYKAPSLKRG